VAYTYNTFAREQPGLYRAAFHPLLQDKSSLPELEAAAAANFRTLGELVQQLGAPEQLPAAVVGAAIWSALHGASVLQAEGWLPGRSGLSPEQLKHALPHTIADLLYDSLISSQTRLVTG